MESGPLLLCPVLLCPVLLCPVLLRPDGLRNEAAPEVVLSYVRTNPFGWR